MMSLLFNRLSSFVITFLPRSKYLSTFMADKFFTTKLPGKHSMITIEIRAE